LLITHMAPNFVVLWDPPDPKLLTMHLYLVHNAREIARVGDLVVYGLGGQ